LTAADFLLHRTRLGLFHPELLRDPPSILQSGFPTTMAAG
jgi:hypothetical protein